MVKFETILPTFIGFTIITLVVVQIASMALGGFFPQLAGVKVGWALTYIIYAGAAIAVMQAATQIGVHGSPLTASYIKWGFVIAVFCMILGIILPYVIPNLFSVIGISKLAPFAIIHP